MCLSFEQTLTLISNTVMPNNNPGIQLEGPDAQMLEAGFNGTLGKHLKSDPEKTVLCIANSGYTARGERLKSCWKTTQERFQKRLLPSQCLSTGPTDPQLGKTLIFREFPMLDIV